MSASQSTQGNSTSTVLGRRLGGELLNLRVTAGLTQTHAAKALTASTTKVAKMERGWVPMRDPDIRALCELYAVHDPGVVGRLLELARIDRERRKAKGWWDDYTTLGVMQEYVTLENAATTIRAWQPGFIPGLLQSPEYVRALRDGPSTSAEVAQRKVPDEEFVAARLARQRRLTDDPPLTLRAVLYEAVLRNFPSSTEAALGQIEHLTKVADLPNVTLQVFPFSGGVHHGLNGPFNIISFTEPGAMDVVYSESTFAPTWVEGGEGAAAYDELFETISERSLSERDSLLFLRNLSKEF
ncbi:helix-turn-helix transcriptional regulator [Streptomyces sp. NBC_00878]|uniref:helix-turn-helix domain-containing protein n=1 Tax=Streptomyces sp. NBC_00878 TaxID=2975854 RepID=UPI00225798D7|nr:helix-turn-helix transcriptional regulator [Streptomyces sp. NBC_00878]MCX4908877.1 helix-turn-helix domain-containing protein [Streptomyces sp. NBC_00878]